MKKSFLMLCAGMFVFLLIGTIIFAATNDTNYYPLAAGNRWEYRITASGTNVSIVQVIGVVSVDGDGNARLRVLRNGLPVAEICYMKNASGIFKTKQITASGLTQYQPVQPLITNNMPVGTAWNWESEDKTKKESVKVLATEKVTVPAGIFDALVISYEGVDGGITYSEKTWFVKDIGYVKNVQLDNGKTITSELIKYQMK